jgi:hypothetical protein
MTTISDLHEHNLTIFHVRWNFDGHGDYSAQMMLNILHDRECSRVFGCSLKRGEDDYRSGRFLLFDEKLRTHPVVVTMPFDMRFHQIKNLSPMLDWLGNKSLEWATVWGMQVRPPSDVNNIEVVFHFKKITMAVEFKLIWSDT